jgi:hypothetical protein
MEILYLSMNLLAPLSLSLSAGKKFFMDVI